MFPVVSNVPVTLAPLLVTTNTLATPPTLVFTFPFTDGIETLDVPLLIPAVAIVVKDKLPAPSVCIN